MKRKIVTLSISFIVFSCAVFLVFHATRYLSIDLLTGHFSDEPVRGKVVKVEESYWGGIGSKRNTGNYNYFYKYSLEGRTYESYSKGEKNAYILGDDVSVIYIIENPEYSYIDQLKPKWISFWPALIYTIFFGTISFFLGKFIIHEIRTTNIKASN